MSVAGSTGGRLAALRREVVAALPDGLRAGTPAAFSSSTARLQGQLHGLTLTALSVAEPRGRIVVAWEWADTPEALEQLALAAAAALGFGGAEFEDELPASATAYLGGGTQLSIQIPVTGDGQESTIWLLLSSELREEVEGLEARGNGERFDLDRDVGDRSGGSGPDPEVIMDIPLDVAVRLGTTHRPIREILALSTGSVIALDRQAGESVDILINDRLMARGDVVVVDGSFGVRITDIISPGDRLDALR